MPIHCEPLTTADGQIIGHVQVADKVYRRFYDQCWSCRRRRRMVRRFDGIYYGYTERCTACGACFQDGVELHRYPDDLEIARRWSAEAIPAREFDRRVREIERRYWEIADGEDDDG